MDILYLNNDHLVGIEGLRDATGAQVAGAVAEATLYESDGVTEVLGVSWPITMAYKGQRGEYSGELPASVEVQDQGRYELKITAVSAGKRFEVTRAVKAERRYT